eukprot:9472242-Pyramimonas_sp.AAC.1
MTAFRTRQRLGETVSACPRTLRNARNKRSRFLAVSPSHGRRAHHGSESCITFTLVNPRKPLTNPRKPLISPASKSCRYSEGALNSRGV